MKVGFCEPFNKVTANASPKASVQVVELVGASSNGQASISSGMTSTKSEFFASVLVFLLVIEIIGILDFYNEELYLLIQKFLQS